MVIAAFPPVDSADEHGLLAIGGDLEVDSLLLAYRSGIFPWPLKERLLTWFAPPVRAVIFFDRFKVSRSLSRVLKRGTYEIKINKNFPAVIEACAELKNRGTQAGTWITRQIIRGYLDFHRAGFAHSFETYLGDTLVGGLYGVSVDGMFAGESMFYREPDASKVALYHLVKFLERQGLEWIDCQVMSPFLSSLGAEEMPRAEFMRLLQRSLGKRQLSFQS